MRGNGPITRKCALMAFIIFGQTSMLSLDLFIEECPCASDRVARDLVVLQVGLFCLFLFRMKV